MNRLKRKLNNSRLDKKVQKEVNHPQNKRLSPEIAAYGDLLTAKELKAKFPRRKKSPSELPNPTKKHFSAKTKKMAKESKRTAPGLAPMGSSPAYAHREGQVWAKTLVKQGVMKRKILNKKLSKKK